MCSSSPFALESNRLSPQPDSPQFITPHRTEQDFARVEGHVFEYALFANMHVLVKELRPDVRAMVDKTPDIKAREYIYDLCRLSEGGDRTKYTLAITWLEGLAETLGISSDDEGYVGLHLALRTQVHALRSASSVRTGSLGTPCTSEPL